MKIDHDDSDHPNLTLGPSSWLRTAAVSPPPKSAEAPALSFPWMLGQETSPEGINHPYNFSPYPQNPNTNNYFMPNFIPLVRNPNPNPRGHGGPIRKRRNTASRRLRVGKSEAVPAKYAWATSRRAGVKSMAELSASGIERVAGEVQCRKCEKTFAVELEIGERFSRLREFVSEKKENLRDRSAPEWDNPAMVDCRECGAKESAKGVVAEKKREINWLFLLLGGFLCCCTLEQLKYCCKHTGNHRTGAKNRVLYLTYLALCKQLDPSGPFDALESA